MMSCGRRLDADDDDEDEDEDDEDDEEEIACGGREEIAPLPAESADT